MSTRGRNAAALGIGALLMATALVFAARSRPRAKATQDAISAIPTTATAVLTLNVPHLRASPFGQSIFGSESTSALPSSVVRICGFDPVSEVQQFGAWLSADRTLGFVAIGAFREQSLVQCAQKVMRERKGDPQVEQRQGFSVVRDAKLGDQSANIAVRNGGPTLLGQPNALRMMLQTLENGRDETNPHLRLREHITGNADVALSVVVGDELRSHIAQVTGQSTNLLTGVTAIAASLELASLAKLRAQVFCERAEPCQTLAKTLIERRDSARDSIAMRVAGVASLLDNAKVDVKADRLTIEASAPTQEVVSVIEKLGRWAKGDENSEVSKPPQPNEVLRP